MPQKKLSDLPERLSIAFLIWGLLDTGKGGVYHDFDRMMSETAERGFNCIRLEDGAGLIDFSRKDGIINGKVPIAEPFPEFSSVIRQMWQFGGNGECDLAARLIAACKAARKYGIKLILSSWYYLHTYWFCHDEEKNRYLHSLPLHERYNYFAHQLNFILDMLRRENLIDTIAFAEIFNEYDGLEFMTGYGSSELTTQEVDAYRSDHEAALSWLEKENPDVLFAADTATPYTGEDLFPRNTKIWNCHNYFLWGIYGEIERNLIWGNADVTDSAELGDTALFLRKDCPALDRVEKCRKGRFSPGGYTAWYRRIWLYNSLNPASFPEISRRLEKRLLEDKNMYLEKIDASVSHALEFRKQHCPDAEIVAGEGTSYCGNTGLIWEDESDVFWEIVEYAVKEYRNAGFQGCVLKTCCGPEDPSWHLSKDRLIRINQMFREKY